MANIIGERMPSNHRLSIKKKNTLQADMFHINDWSDLQEKLKDEYNFMNLGYF